MPSNKNGRTPLQWAVRNGHKDVAELLRVHGGLDASAEIQEAARDGNLAKIQTLLKDAPGLVSSKDDFGMTPLHFAASSGRKDAAELLLASRASVNAKDNNGWTPLHMAAVYGHKEIAELLLANHADVNARDNAGMTPLHSAAFNDRTDVAQLLLANHADVHAKDKHGATPARGGDLCRARATSGIVVERQDQRQGCGDQGGSTSASRDRCNQ